VPNLADFNLQGFGDRMDPVAERPFLVIGRAFGDQAVLWGTGPRVVLLYPGYDPAWLDDLARALAEDPPRVVTPACRSGRLVADLLDDEIALARLREALGPPTTVRLECFGSTPEIYMLAAAVEAAGHQILLDVPPSRQSWLTGVLDSKVPLPELTDLPELAIPPTWTAWTWGQLQGIVKQLAARGQPVFVKAPHGVGGAGCLRIEPSGVESSLVAMAGDPFFRNFPVVVQEAAALDADGCMRGVDFCVTDEGFDQTIVSLDPGGGVQYATLGDGGKVLPSPAAVELTKRAARAIGKLACGLGYRGWMGVDLLPGADGRLYLIEINARRTGSMHAAGLLSRSTGERAVACSRDVVAVGAGPLTYEAVRDVFRAAWDRGLAVYPTTVRGLGRPTPLAGLVAAGPDMATAAGSLDEVVHAVRQRAGAVAAG
jgi:hypothetical protein